MTQSIDKLQKKLDKDPNSLIFFQLAEEHRKEGNLGEAQSILEKGLTRHPNYWSAHVSLARIYHQEGDLEPAQEELEKVIHAVPDHPLANRLLGEIYLGKKLNSDALKCFQIVQMLNPSDQEIAAHVKKLEAELVVPQTEPQTQVIATPLPPPPFPTSSVESEPQAHAIPAPVPRPSFPSTALEPEPEPESYAPTIQMQIPQFLEKTDAVARTVVPEKHTESFIETIPAEEEPPANPYMPDNTDDPERYLIEEEKSEFSQEPEDEDELFVESAEPILEDALREETPGAADELSSIANLLLTADDSDFQELEPEMEDSEFEIEPEPELPPKVLDRTQPIAESEAGDDADELTTETLAELYLNQGLVDKAIKVYQKLLLNDPGNLRIMTRLRTLTSEDAFFGNNGDDVIEEPVMVEAEPSASNSSVNADPLTQRAEERRRKIHTLESWLTTIRRERSN